MKKNYWTEFWRDQGANSRDSDPQSQVLRTFSKQPLDDQRWCSTLRMVREQMEMVGGHRMLDLCCGNGLFTRHFARDCDRLLAVDISPDLLVNLEGLGLDGVETLESDVRAVDFPQDTFDRILLYAAVQYLEPSDVVRLFERMAVWLEPSGILYVGDVPDQARIWRFFDNDERQAAYFRNVRDGEAIIGTWFDAEWLRRLGLYAGFREVEIIDQPNYMLYHTFRYEAVFTR